MSTKIPNNVDGTLMVHTLIYIAPVTTSVTAPASLCRPTVMSAAVVRCLGARNNIAIILV